MDLSILNEQQQEAVMHGENPCLVLAGAGSGKTKVLTHRIVRLIEDGIDPQSILACTFSKKASLEMQERLELMLGKDVMFELQVSTFHSVCFAILREEYKNLGIAYNLKVIKDGQKKIMAKDILQDKRKDGSRGLNWDQNAMKLLAIIGRGKNDLFGFMEPEMYFDSIDFISPYKLYDFYRMFEKEKRKNNLVDFDDMLYLAFTLLNENPSILRKYQEKWQWILIDETQDSNISQYKIAEMIAKPENNIFVVGDDAQSIYGFRGACPKISILGFMERYPNGKIIKLEKNYRSSTQIVDNANKLKLANPFGKVLISTRESCKDIGFKGFGNTYEEAEWIGQEIESLVAEGYHYKDMAVLYRTNAQSEALELTMILKRIPYFMPGSIGFYARQEIADITAYLQLAHDPNSEAGTEALWSVWNIASKYSKKGTHYFGNALKDMLINKSRVKGNGNSPWKCLIDGHFKSWQNQGVYDLRLIIDSMKSEEKIAGKIRKIMNIAYERYLEKEENDFEEEGNPRVENINRLMDIVEKFDSLEDFLFYVDNIRKNSPKEEPPDAVKLMTVHKSKGLEFEIVFGVGLSDGILPHYKAEDKEEERRICYVMVTRAKRILNLSSISRYNNKEFEPSPFLYEMELIDDEEELANETFQS